jgi:adenosylhomocysteine nucleosidase
MIGIITGLAAEAEILRAARIDAAIRCCGSRPEAALTEARALVAAGATALLSFGVAGALARIAIPGQIVLADEIVLPDGRRLRCSALWHEAMAERLAGLPVRLHRGAIAGSATPVCRAADKHALRRHTGAMAVDMESQVVAAAAAEAALPFLAIRAIADPVDQDVPAFAMSGVDAAGHTHVAPVIAGLLRRPWALPDLIRLGRHFNAALAGLRHAAALASPDVACHTLGRTESLEGTA